MSHTKTVLGYEIDFVRRRYGRTTFTWLHVTIDGQRHEIGTPWQCIVPARKEMEREIRLLVESLTTVSPGAKVDECIHAG